MSLRVEHGEQVSHVYPHRKDYPLGLLYIMLLITGLSTLYAFSNLSRSEAGYFVRYEPGKRFNKRMVVRDAAGREFRLSHDGAVAGVQPGDLVVKSPGAFELQRFPAGTPIPEPVWHRGGRSDTGSVVALIVLALAASWAVWGYESRRWVFDRAAARLRCEWRATPWHWVKSLERPLDWIRGMKLKVRRAKENEQREWDVTLQGTCGTWYVLGTVKKAEQATELLAPLSDILPRLKKGEQ